MHKILVPLFFVIVLGVISFFVYNHFASGESMPISPNDRKQVRLMPLPASLVLNKGSFPLDAGFLIKFEGERNSLLDSAIIRLKKHISEKTNIQWERSGSSKVLLIKCVDCVGDQYPTTEADESYSLKIGRSKIELKAETNWGVLHGLETMKQLLEKREEGFVFPTCEIKDMPRFPWRGLMLDVSRRWMPKETVLRILEGMASVKLNIFHWHLTDDQGFRVESKVFPKLHEMGSEGDYYSQADILEIIEFARLRGIQVVPEFDLPGHSISWFVGYPELGSKPGPFELPQKFGLAPVAFDPSQAKTYEFLTAFLEEMASLFPSKYIHLGGDEVNVKAWEENEELSKFMIEKEIEDYHGLQAYFNHKMSDILIGFDKKMVGWDEIYHPDLSNTESVIQAWRSHSVLFEAAADSFPVILSSGWYLDHKLPAEKYYTLDPEKVEGGVNIEPDSVWQSWDLVLQVRGTEIPASMTLFGTENELRGVMGVMDNLTAFEKATLKEGVLEFELEAPMGTLNFEADLVENKLTGKVSLALLGFDVSGKKVGSNKIEGTFPPKIKKVPALTPEMGTLILGGETCMWSEVVSANTVESRIWPSAGAIAEKLWSPTVLTNDPKDMYRRLDHLSDHLDEKGLRHLSYRGPLLGAIAPNSPDISALEAFVDILEESKYYSRHGQMLDLERKTPLRFLADAAAPESPTARFFRQKVDAFLADSIHQVAQKDLLRSMRSWEANHRPFTATIAQNPGLKPYENMSLYLAAISRIGMKAVHAIVGGTHLLADEKDYNYEMLDKASQAVLGAELAIVPAIRILVDAAYQE